MPVVLKPVKKLSAYILDRLTLCCTDPNTEYVNKTAGMLIDYNNKTWMPGFMVTSNARYKASARIPVPFKPDVSRSVVTFEAGPHKPKMPSYRLDFNPSKISPAGLDDLMVFLDSVVDPDALTFFRMSKVTRCDVALDLPGLDLSKVIVRSSGLQKHSVYSDRHGNPQTVYLGTPRSRRLAAYDKPVPGQVEKQLRLECRLKPQCLGHELAKLQNPFRKVQLFPAGFAVGLDLGIPAQYIADSFRIGGLKRALAPLDKPHRKLLKKALAEAKQVELPDPEQLWSKWPETLIGYGLGKELGAIPVAFATGMAGTVPVGIIKAGVAQLTANTVDVLDTPIFSVD
jgi:hypothetical protein